ncbi:MAG: iron ABC transporter permease [Flavobacteriales bacterium]|nr:iron ABC transporter permease [Flavobacteriales bacterium]
MRPRIPFLFILLAILLLAGFAWHLSVGSTYIDARAVWRGLLTIEDAASPIMRTVRFPQAITALLAGAGLAVSGVLMQTLFRNPLAGPSVLGISSGASLGVALLMLVHPLWAMLPIPADAALVIAAFLGGMLVLGVVILADRRLGDGVTLLIVGLMVGYLCSALISVLQLAGAAAALKGYVLWGLGSFSGVGPDRLPWLVIPVCAGMVSALLLMKPLNAFLLGEDHAATVGVRVRPVRRRIMWITGVLAGTITAFCGPIAFLGLATPHVARALFRTSDHKVLLPGSMLCGAVLALLCDVVVKLPAVGHMVPLNAVTALLGAPVIAWVLFSGKRWARSA